MAKLEKQELHCHNCDKYVQFSLDMELDGNHVLKCPNCGHEHCRVVQNGKITDTRWDTRNGKGLVTNPAAPSLTAQGMLAAQQAQMTQFIKGMAAQALGVAPNGLPVYQVPPGTTSYTVQSTFDIYQATSTTGDVYLYGAWMDTTALRTT